MKKASTSTRSESKSANIGKNAEIIHRSETGTETLKSSEQKVTSSLPATPSQISPYHTEAGTSRSVNHSASTVAHNLSTAAKAVKSATALITSDNKSTSGTISKNVYNKIEGLPKNVSNTTTTATLNQLTDNALSNLNINKDGAVQPEARITGNAAIKTGMVHKDFAKAVYAHAKADEKRTSIPAIFLTAQCCLESYYGCSDLAKATNNLFGMRGTGSAGKYYNSNGEWAKYKSTNDSIIAYENLLGSYKSVMSYYKKIPMIYMDLQ